MDAEGLDAEFGAVEAGGDAIERACERIEDLGRGRGGERAGAALGGGGGADAMSSQSASMPRVEQRRPRKSQLGEARRGSGGRSLGGRW